MHHADLNLSPEGVAARLEQMRVRTPWGNVKWFPSTVGLLLQRAEKTGLIDSASDG